MTKSLHLRIFSAAWFLTLFLLVHGSSYAQTQSRRTLLISVADRKLAVIEHGAVKKIYPIAVGTRATPSPTGSFFIVDRVTDPTYYHPNLVVLPGPHNPLGTRWIGLSEKGYGIHGTNAPKSIGKAASHGCIRMARSDLEELFSQTRVGDKVLILGERDDLTAQVFGTSDAEVALGTPTRVALVHPASGQ
jgi:lipoprotein-anchoring transpeptidase ErfK/SrfK